MNEEEEEEEGGKDRKEQIDEEKLHSDGLSHNCTG
jgi:hypothetical protein